MRLLIVLQQGEQPIIARCVVELGAEIVLGKSPSDETRRRSAARLLIEPAFKDAANHIGAALRTIGGASKAADVIEEFRSEKASFG